MNYTHYENRKLLSTSLDLITLNSVLIVMENQECIKNLNTEERLNPLIS